MKSILLAVFVVAAALVVAEEPEQPPDNRDGHCDRCGSCQCIRRVPVPKPVMQKKTKICWDAETEDVILPDGVHLTAGGNRIVARVVRDALVTEIKRE